MGYDSDIEASLLIASLLAQLPWALAFRLMAPAGELLELPLQSALHDACKV
jgi:hypothetical protein